MPSEGMPSSGRGASAISASRPAETTLSNGDKGKQRAGGVSNGDAQPMNGSGTNGEAGFNQEHDYTEGVPIAVVQAVIDERKREEQEREYKGGDMMVGSWASWAGNDDGEPRDLPLYVFELTYRPGHLSLVHHSRSHAVRLARWLSTKQYSVLPIAD